MSFETHPLHAASYAASGRRRLATRLIERMLPALQGGHLNIHLPNGDTILRAGSQPGPEATIAIRRWNALLRIFAAGETGFSDGFIAGDWTSPNLTALLTLFDRNAGCIARASKSTAAGLLRDRLTHLRNRNTRRGSRRNIAAHYDLGNAFYRLWLDAGMNYSSALFHSNESLEQAQIAKLDRVVELLTISGGERVLEIGCGWGALAERLSDAHSCRVTGLTLSNEQLGYARRRLGARGDVRLQDYRDCSGQFDRIVSIEMLEAVGERFWQTYFDVLRARLARHGVAVLQVITIDESRFETYRRRPDFIQRHIFPGGMLPTRSAIEQKAERAGFRVTSWTAFGQSYARTLCEWRTRFERSATEIEALGLDQRFQKMWNYYLCYCEAGFLSGAIDVNLIRLAVD